MFFTSSHEIIVAIRFSIDTVYSLTKKKILEKSAEMTEESKRSPPL